MTVLCPICGKHSVRPNGRTSADVLLVLGEPDDEDLRLGYPFSGQSGEILKAELGRVGIQMEACRAVCIYSHPHAVGDSMMCIDRSVEDFGAEMKNRRGILLFGAQASKFFGYEINDVSGLIIKPELLPEDVIVVVAPHPGMLKHTPVGEMRLALKIFKEAVW